MASLSASHQPSTNSSVCLRRVLTHSTILQEVWGAGYQKDTQLLRGFVAQIRQQIELSPNPPHSIITEPGIGYLPEAGAYHILNLSVLPTNHLIPEHRIHPIEGLHDFSTNLRVFGKERCDHWGELQEIIACGRRSPLPLDKIEELGVVTNGGEG